MSDLAELIKAERYAADLNADYDGGVGTHDDYVNAKAATDAAIANLTAAQAVSLPDREKIVAVLAEGLGDTYSCTRVWEAWQYGTMTQDDFSLASEDEELLASLTDAVLAALSTQPDGYCVCDGEIRMGDCGIVAHRAEAKGLSTQPAAGEVEWEYGVRYLNHPAGDTVFPTPQQAARDLAEESSGGVIAMRRETHRGPWIEVQS